MLTLKEKLVLSVIKIYKQLLEKHLKQALLSIRKLNLDNEGIMYY